MIEQTHGVRTDHDAPNAIREPLPPFKFLFLAREIRDQIYTWALSSPSPIIVWKGEWVTQFDESSRPYTTFTDIVEHEGTIWKRGVDPSVTKTSLGFRSTSLFFCNKEIGKEAAEVFYKRNVFAFLGEHNWDPIVSWLTKIGDRNRSNLSRIEINAYKPEEVWQRHTGERVQNSLNPSREPVYPRSEHLQLRTPLKYGLVENINPALEMIFQLLGRRISAHKLTLDFKLRSQSSTCEYPGQGLYFREDDHYPVQGWCSLDLPNLIEKFRTDHTKLYKDSLEPPIEVIWTGKCPRLILYRQYEKLSRTTIQDQLQNIKDHGWEIEISAMQGDDWEWGTYSEERDKELHIPTFVLRRKPLEEPLKGDDPNPYSDTGGYIQPGDVEWELEQTNHYYS